MSLTAAGLEGKCEIRDPGQVGQVLQGRVVVPEGHRSLTQLQHPFPAVKCFVFS